MRRTLVIVAVAAACGVAAAPAYATNECRGLQICVPVAGPWVVAKPGQVEYQLSCPRRFIVGGLDAEVSSRGIDVGFVGSLGSPVNPGITTSRDAVFLGRFVRGVDSAPTFRPHIGCIPAQGGGRRSPTTYDALAPGKPTVRHVSEITALPGITRHAKRGCPSGERLVTATYAVGFYGPVPPAAVLANAVHVVKHVKNGRVSLAVRGGNALTETRAVVQLELLCTPR